LLQAGEGLEGPSRLYRELAPVSFQAKMEEEK